MVEWLVHLCATIPGRYITSFSTCCSLHKKEIPNKQQRFPEGSCAKCSSFESNEKRGETSIKYYVCLSCCCMWKPSRDHVFDIKATLLTNMQSHRSLVVAFYSKPASWFLTSAFMKLLSFLRCRLLHMTWLTLQRVLPYIPTSHEARE